MIETATAFPDAKTKDKPFNSASEHGETLYFNFIQLFQFTFLNICQFRCESILCITGVSSFRKKALCNCELYVFYEDTNTRVSNVIKDINFFIDYLIVVPAELSEIYVSLYNYYMIS